MLPRFPHRSELENAVRGTKLNSSTARQKNMMLSAGVLKVCAFTCAQEMLCFTMHFHDTVNALAKMVMWKLACLCGL